MTVLVAFFSLVPGARCREVVVHDCRPQADAAQVGAGGVGADAAAVLVRLPEYFFSKKMNMQVFF